MKIHPQAVSDSVVGGITTALVWAALLWGYNWFRNFRLRRKLLKVFSKQSSGWGVDGFGFGLTNFTNIPVTVRDVRILHGERPRRAYKLNYIGPSHDVIEEHHPRRKRPKIFDPKVPDEEMIAWSVQRPPETDERGFATLPPQTGGEWRMPIKGIRDDMHIDEIRVVIEYTTLFGNRAVVPVFAKEKTLEFLNDMLERAKKDKPKVQHNPRS